MSRHTSTCPEVKGQTVYADIILDHKVSWLYRGCYQLFACVIVNSRCILGYRSITESISP